MRVAATVISAFIDPYVRITGSLTLGVAGILDGRLAEALPPPLYARVRDQITFSAGAMTLLFLLVVRFRRRFLR